MHRRIEGISGAEQRLGKSSYVFVDLPKARYDTLCVVFSLVEMQEAITQGVSGSAARCIQITRY